MQQQDGANPAGPAVRLLAWLLTGTAAHGAARHVAVRDHDRVLCEHRAATFARVRSSGMIALQAPLS